MVAINQLMWDFPFHYLHRSSSSSSKYSIVVIVEIGNQNGQQQLKKGFHFQFENYILEVNVPLLSF